MAAPGAAVYGRMGTSTQRFGGACSWLIACLNVLTGNVDRPGGVMFPLSASVYRPPRTPASEHRDRWHSRVRGLGELLGELPAVTLAEDILTPGPGRIRGLVTVAGNPAVSVPGSVAMHEALADLELMISIDSYVNETTRHADVILPGESPFERPHFPFLTRFAVRNVVQWSDPVLPPEGDRPREWEALLRVAAAFEQRTDIDVASDDDAAFAGRVAAEVRDPRSPVHGRDPDEIVRLAGPARGPERLIDFRFRVGPYGDGYGADPDGLSIDKLRRHPHGIDLGPLRPRLADVVATRSGRIELAHPELAAELERALAEPPPSAGSLLLVSRRSLRSNNSWMHNIPKLVSGRPRCTLLIHPDDAAARGVADGDVVHVRSATGAVLVPAEVTADIMAGVVNLPHGWGHDLPGMRMAVAAASPGVNSNLLGDGTLVDGLTNTAVTNGIPVTVEPSAAPGAVDGRHSGRAHDERAVVGVSAGSRLPGSPTPMHEWVVGGGVRLAGDSWGDPSGPLVILQHGGGQTRHAWKGTGQTLAAAGYHAVAFDARGHGDSEWVADGDYTQDAMVDDLVAVVEALDGAVPCSSARRWAEGRASWRPASGTSTPPASCSSTSPRGSSSTARRRSRRSWRQGKDGFTTLDDVADAIADVPAPPAPAAAPRRSRQERPTRRRRALPLALGPAVHARACATSTTATSAWRRAPAPWTCRRCSCAADSPTSSPRRARVEFLELCPHAEYVNVPGAAHMVAGDRNDIFGDAVVDFLARHVPADGGPPRAGHAARPHLGPPGGRSTTCRSAGSRRDRIRHVQLIDRRLVMSSR